MYTAVKFERESLCLPHLSLDSEAPAVRAVKCTWRAAYVSRLPSSHRPLASSSVKGVAVSKYTSEVRLEWCFVHSSCSRVGVKAQGDEATTVPATSAFDIMRLVRNRTAKAFRS